MGKALYRSYRSRKLSEIVGQDHVTTLLENAIKTNRIAHAYLFTGPRGVGKTSIARILAHEINDIPYTDDSTELDIIEIDAASNNGVDDIRELREKTMIAPAKSKYKVYIIDEVHMLSKSAFNALLKTLEEPPEHVVFILATTDAEKLPPTIVSRTQRHTFRRASIPHLVENLQRIAKAEKISIDDDALTLIAEHADGGFRDSVSLFDQLMNISDATITAAMIEESLGLTPAQDITRLTGALAAKDFTSSSQVITELIDRGLDVKILIKQLIDYITKSSPELLPAISELISASISSHPYAALMAAVAEQTLPKTAIKSAPALIATPPKTLLEAKADQPHPKDDIVTKQIASVPKSLKKETVSEPIQEITKTGKKPSSELDWAAFTAATKEQSIGLFSILSKCGHKIDDTTLTIYTKTEFPKKKLSTAANQQVIHATLSTLTGGDWDVNILAEATPLKDSQAASIAAMMGGGEEVSL